MSKYKYKPQSNFVKRTTRKILVFVFITLLNNSLYADVSSAFVEKVSNDNAIIITSKGKYYVEKGVGCISLWRYEGKSILIKSPGLFLGIGSSIILPDEDQECRIWESSAIDDSSPIRSITPPSQIEQQKELQTEHSTSSSHEGVANGMPDSNGYNENENINYNKTLPNYNNDPTSQYGISN